MKNKRGSLSVEAALVLSTFIIVIFSIIYLVKVIYIHEQVQFAITEAAKEMSVGAYALDKTGLLDLQQETYVSAKGHLDNLEESFQKVVSSYSEVTNTVSGLTNYSGVPAASAAVVTDESTSKDLAQELFYEKQQLEAIFTQGQSAITELLNFLQVVTQDSKGIVAALGIVPGMEVINNYAGTKIVNAIVSEHISSEDYSKWGILGKEAGMDYSNSQFMLENEDITIFVHYQIEMPFLKNLLNPIDITQGVQVRAFTGNENFESAFEKEEDKLKEDEDSETVYITRTGKRYHKDRNCRYIDVKINSVLYVEVKGSKKICEVCAKDSVTVNDLSTVFSTQASDVYHTNGTCWTITRDVNSVTMEEALENSYTPCKLCGEGE